MKMSLVFLAALFCSHAFSQNVQRIAFGSCSHQDKPQPIWSQVLGADPDLFIFLGDNIYGDSEDPAVLAAKYQKLASISGVAELRRQVPVIATWDDHDYGKNDSGSEFVGKESSRKVMLDFWGEPENSPRRTRSSGIYTSYYYGEKGKRVQVLMLDLRWNRTELVELEDEQRLQLRRSENRGPYDASLAATATLLGEDQWDWLEAELQVEADVRIIASSIQLLAEFTGWETWANYPKDRQRFFEMLEIYQQEPILILSGDVHWSEYSEISETANGWPLIELTSSGLTEEWKAISPNRHRVGEAFAVANFGLIEIDWSENLPTLNLTIRDVSGEDLISKKIRFD
ncbi:MAG: alkaline phosphatase D family protein [Pseudohongiellaceae bacterium]